MVAVYDQLKTFNTYCLITKDEAQFIYKFLKEKKFKKTLEVGFGPGCSAAYIMLAIRNTHYAIDPNKNFSNLGIKNIKKLGLKKYLIFENDYSHNVLPKLLKKGIKINFAFIDGGHKFDDIFIDFYFIDLLLNQKGYVMFHDTWMRSTQHVVSWIKNNKKNYKFIKVPVKSLILIQKIGKDNRLRTWYHFKGFCTWKSFIPHTFYVLLRRYNLLRKITKIKILVNKKVVSKI